MRGATLSPRQAFFGSPTILRSGAWTESIWGARLRFVQVRVVTRRSRRCSSPASALLASCRGMSWKPYAPATGTPAAFADPGHPNGDPQSERCSFIRMSSRGTGLTAASMPVSRPCGCSTDHVLPHSRGGNHGPDNVVITVCPGIRPDGAHARRGRAGRTRGSGRLQSASWDGLECPLRGDHVRGSSPRGRHRAAPPRRSAASPPTATPRSSPSAARRPPPLVDELDRADGLRRGVGVAETQGAPSPAPLLISRRRRRSGRYSPSCRAAPRPAAAGRRRW